VVRFGSVDSDLYRRILERCVEPGTPCTSEQMTSADHAHESPGESRP